jgi:hypothetical protein
MRHFNQLGSGGTQLASRGFFYYRHEHRPAGGAAKTASLPVGEVSLLNLKFKNWQCDLSSS